MLNIIQGKTFNICVPISCLEGIVFDENCQSLTAYEIFFNDCSMGCYYPTKCGCNAIFEMQEGCEKGEFHAFQLGFAKISTKGKNKSVLHCQMVYVKERIILPNCIKKNC